MTVLMVLRVLVRQFFKILLIEKKVDYVIAVGPMPMMRAVAELTRDKGIYTEASMNPIMVDGTGMCGACRGYSRRRNQVCVC